MKIETLSALFKALREEKVRYLVTGGLAVVAHGYLRFTADIDLFVEEPIAFEEAYSRRMQLRVSEGVEASVIGLDDLITLKKRAGRVQDLHDIEKLNAIREG